MTDYVAKAAEQAAHLNAATDSLLVASATADALRALAVIWGEDSDPRAVYAVGLLLAEADRQDMIALDSAEAAQAAAEARRADLLTAAVVKQKVGRRHLTLSPLAKDFAAMA